MLTREKDNIEHSNFFGTAKKIQATNIIKSTAQGVEYKASQSIELLPITNNGVTAMPQGFIAEQGSDFTAYIDPNCNTSNPNLLYHAQADRPTRNSDNTSNRSNRSTGNELEKNQVNTIVLYPNPTKTEVNISYNIHKTSTVSITINDMSGKTVYKRESSETFPSGNYTNRIATDQLPSGTYLVTVETAEYREVKKLIIQ